MSHVYNLGLPADAREYLHRAGRAGRIGSTTGGLVTSVVTAEELPALAAIAEQLGVALAVEDERDQGLGLLPPAGSAAEVGEGGDGAAAPAAGGNSLDALKRGLEDIYRLF